LAQEVNTGVKIARSFYWKSIWIIGLHELTNHFIFELWPWT
jgi:hypothetical protein